MAADVVKLDSAKTVEGGDIAIKTMNGGVMVNNAHVTKADIVATQRRDPRDRHGAPAEVKVDRMHLLTGATGYVGGRLLRRLERDGVAVRCLCRNPEALGWRVGSRHRSGAGRPARAGVSGGGIFGSGYSFLSSPFHECRRRSSKPRSAGGREFRARRRARRECGASSIWAGWRTAKGSRRICAAGPRRARYCAPAAFR